MEDHKYYIHQLEDLDDIKQEGNLSLYFVLQTYSIDLVKPIFQKINRLKEVKAWISSSEKFLS